MSDSDLHPDDDLLVRAMTRDLRAEPVSPADALDLDRLVSGAMGELGFAPEAASPATQPARPDNVRALPLRTAARSPRPYLLFAAALLVLSVAAAAVLYRARRAPAGSHDARPSASAHSPSLPAPEAPTPPASPATGTPPAPSPPAPAMEPAPAAPSLATHAPRRASQGANTNSANEETPAALFARANAARQRRDYAEAERLYTQLQSRHGSSREATLSRVTLARMLLDRGESASRAAQLFDAYLRQAPRGELAETALAGLATAQMRQGRAAAERAAWTSLLRAYPDSVHAAQARARLAALH